MNYFISATRGELRVLREALIDLDSHLEKFGKGGEADDQIEIRMKSDSNIEITIKDTKWDDIIKR